MADALKSEVERNYDFFQRNLTHFLGEYAGEYALLKSAAVVDFFAAGRSLSRGVASFSRQAFLYPGREQRTSRPGTLFGWRRLAGATMAAES